MSVNDVEMGDTTMPPSEDAGGKKADYFLICFNVSENTGKNELLLTPSQAKALSQKNKRWEYVPVTETKALEEQLPAKRERKQIHLNDYIFPTSSRKKDASAPESAPPAAAHTKEPAPIKARTSMSSRRSTAGAATAKKAANTTTTTKSKRGQDKTAAHDSDSQSASPEKNNIAKMQETIHDLSDKLRVITEQIQSGTVPYTSPTTSPKINTTAPAKPAAKSAKHAPTTPTLLSPPPRKFSNLYSDDEEEMETEVVVQQPPPTRKTSTAATTHHIASAPSSAEMMDFDLESDGPEFNSEEEQPRQKNKRKSTSSSTPPAPRPKAPPKKQRNSAPNTPLARSMPALAISGAASTTERAQRSTKGRRRYATGDVALVGPMRRCLEILDFLMAHQHAYPFLVPVDPIALNILDYFTIIKHPMDFRTIRQTLVSGVYQSSDEFASDMRLVFDNAKEYNPPSNPVHTMAQTLEDIFEKKYHKAQTDPPSPEIRHEDNDKLRRLTISSMAKELEKIKGTKRTSIPSRRYLEDSNPMTLEEKTQLGAAINVLPTNKLPQLIEIISHTLQDMAQEEIEIDLERLDAGTLRRLENFVISCFPEGTYYTIGQSTPILSGSSAGVPTQKQREIENVQKQIKELTKLQRNKKSISKPISKARGRKMADRLRREEEVVVDDMSDERREYPSIVIEKDHTETDGTSGSDSSSESDSSDSDSSSSYSSDDYSDSESDRRPPNTGEKPSLSSPKTTSISAPSLVSAPTPQIIPTANKKSIGVPSTVASWSFDNLSTTTTTVPSDSATSPSSLSISTSTPPILPQASPLSPSPPIVMATPQSPTSTTNTITNSASSSSSTLTSPSSPSNNTDQTWAHFKAKNITLQQKEKERQEQEELLRKEREEREEELRREEEKKRNDALEAIRKQKEKEEQEAEESRKQLELERIAAREAREKSQPAKSGTMSFQYQMEVMADFENNFSSNSMDNSQLHSLPFKRIEESYDSPAVKE
eukprot:gene14490-17099_t